RLELLARLCADCFDRPSVTSAEPLRACSTSVGSEPMKLTITLLAAGFLKKLVFATSTACLFGSYDCSVYGPTPAVCEAIHVLTFPFCTPPCASMIFDSTIDAAGCAQSCRTFASGWASVIRTVSAFGVSILLISGGV